MWGWSSKRNVIRRSPKASERKTRGNASISTRNTNIDGVRAAADRKPDRRVLKVDWLVRRHRQTRSAHSWTKVGANARSGVRVQVEDAADAAGAVHVVSAEVEVEAADRQIHAAIVNAAAIVGISPAAVAIAGVAVHHLLALVVDVLRPQWNGSGRIAPLMVAAPVHRERLIHSIGRNRKPGCRERVVCICLANSITRKRRRAVRHQMSTLLRDWDEGSKSKRKKLLEWFCSRFDPTQDGGGLLESEFGADIALFLPRLLSWMQKTTATAVCCPSKPDSASAKPTKVKCFALSEQVACLHVFFGAVNSHAYYREFQHADGLQLVLKIVAIQGNDVQTQEPLVSVSDRETLLRIILRISKMNRQCKEEISCLDGELAVIQGVLAGGDAGDWKQESRVWTLCREVLLEQLVGNPTCLDRAHEAVIFMLRHSEVRLRLFGAQVLRELITDTSFSFDPEYRRRKESALVPLCLSLLHSTDVYLHHESLELLHALLQSKHLQDLICEKLVRLVGESAKALDAKVEERFAPIEETTEYETYVHLRSTFTIASQAINTLMHSNRNLLPILVDHYGLLTPLAFVLVIERPHSLKWHAAAISIHYTLSHYYRRSSAYLSELFEIPTEELLEWKDKRGDEGEMLAEFLLGDEAHQSNLALRFYQRGWYRPLSPRKQSEHFSTDHVLNDIEHGVETAARDYVPELQVQTRVGENADETEDVEILEAQREHHLRLQLQKHFSQFRHMSVATPATTTTSN